MPVEDLTEEEVMNAVTIGLTGITVRLLTCFLFTARADFFCVVLESGICG